MAGNDERKPIHLFVPGEMALLIEHPEGVNRDTVLKFVTVLFDGVIDEIDPNNDYLPRNLPNGEETIRDNPFSLVFIRAIPDDLSDRLFRDATVPNSDDSTNGLSGVASASELSKYIIYLYLMIAQKDPQRTIGAHDLDVLGGKYRDLTAFNQKYERLIALEEEYGVNLTAATPNWLLSGNPVEPPDGSGGGGPGSIPVEGHIDGHEQDSVWDPTAPWSLWLDRLSPTWIRPFNELKPLLDLHPRMAMIPRGEGTNRFEIHYGQDDREEDVGIQKVEDAYAYIEELMTLSPDSLDSKVEVAILDTVPLLDEDIQAAKKWFNTHPFVDSLLEINCENKVQFKPDRVRVSPYESYPDPISIPGTNEKFDLKWAASSCFPYPATDHGLFIAGIVHSLAPQAKLHLVEALNPYGVGSMEMVAAQLLHAFYSAQEDNVDFLIVNMSMMFDFPWDQHHLISDCLGSYDDELHLLKRFLIDDKTFARNMASPLEYVCDLLKIRPADAAEEDLEEDTEEDDEKKKTRELKKEIKTIVDMINDRGVVVASAGNDGGKVNVDSTDPTPKIDVAARFPAAFKNVIGVGALNNNFERAKYSNLSDTPLEAGIAVLGGETVQAITSGYAPPKLETTHQENGILGFYIGPFPNTSVPPKEAYDIAVLKGTSHLSENTTGWARWSGTSFAAAIVSGYLAHLVWLQFKGTPSILLFYFMLRGAFHKPEKKEYHLRMKQGPKNAS
jgi:hypothetical protein